MDHTSTILQLLASGHQLAAAAEREENIHRHETLARQAVGYFGAAATLLGAFGELHDQLIEHPDFVAARKFQRRYYF